jgi:4'-phosphopantetheinyl transferase EntD
MNELHAPSWPNSIVSSLTHWECLISKESIYKAWYPLTQALVGLLGGGDCRQACDSEFQRHLRVPAPSQTDEPRFNGRWPC